MSGESTDSRLTACQWHPDEDLVGIRRKLTLFVPLNIALAVWYFGWLLRPGHIGNRFLFALLIAAEVFNLVQALGFWWTVFNARPRRAPSPAVQAAVGVRAAVDVLIPVYNEPVEIVEPTIAAAVGLLGADVKVYLLDDKGRDDLAALAARHGVHYLRRGDNVGAKAGNLNHALALTSSPFVAVFDCDHVPSPDFLIETAPLMAEPEVALVQTPQYYANVEHNPMAAAAWSQQALFFGIIAQGKNGLGTMFCCGTNFLFRRAAMQEIGGFPEDSLTEDFLLSVKLHERGWRTDYLPKVLAQGLGPEDAASYVSQQRRWAKGCIAAIPAALRAHLPWRRRMQYLLSSSFFVSGWAVLVYMSLPVIRILTGSQPLAKATADQFLIHFVPYYFLSLIILSVAGAGRYTFAAFCLFVTNYWIHIDATLSTILRRSGGFIVTPKKGSTARQPRAVAPALVTAAILGAVAVGGLIGSSDPGTLNNVAFAGFHISLLLGGAWPALVRNPSAPGLDGPESAQINENDGSRPFHDSLAVLPLS